MNRSKVYIRILEKDDIKTTSKWINTAEISDIMGYLPVMSLDSQYDYYDKLKNDKSRFVFAICLNNGDIHIGNIALGNVDYISRHAMFSIFIFEEMYRSGGLGTEATKLCLNFAFKQLNLNKVYLRVSPDSIKAINLYLKTGFIKEGVLRQHYYSDGKYQDKEIYSILRDEYLI